LFSYKPNKDQNFDRFNNRYDIWLKPLFKIGHFYFCPLGFLSNNAWFYAFAQSALTYRVIPFKNETSTVEKTVAERFALKGFPTKVITENDANSIDGDVDIIIEDHELTLLIQVKRSHFRVTLKEAHFETLFSVKKAAYQLVQAEKCLLEDNSIFKLKNKPIKWIVSSSFENIGEVYGGCRKVNYFELINAINNPNVRSLKDIISDVETDKNFNDFLNSQFDDSVPPEIRKYIAEISGPSKTGQNDVNHLLFRLEL
jgi:hypothetical protein